ncbi:hypothetical protein EDB94_0785 [Marinobacter sp. 3-2]|uniref:hypothetical protein n=1 Tax=Marinobacter sp. 3-2 TaxID=2485141 RepID=UPI000D3967D8|nr:hypothetical protein [Marinobacter sp. 3-2]ROQ47069.1 hypothetical protein EDB94_0785 [Marinobacter sp. 3-2]
MEEFEEIRAQVLERMIKTSFCGYDPSAINFSKRAIKIRHAINKVPNRIVRKVINSVYSRFIYYSGEYAVYLLRPQKAVYSKGLALILSGLACDDTPNDELIDLIIDLIMSKRISGTFLWAHDIDYSFPGGRVVTTQTPNLVTTAFVANAFYDLYKKTKRVCYKETFNKIVLDLLENVPYKELSNDKICFMYTPITEYHVHNANLLYAELLAKKIHLGSKDADHLTILIQRALNYSLSDFSETNTYPYAGPPTRKLAIDNYHTGYLLRSLREIDCLIGGALSEDLGGEISRLLSFYIRSFVADGYIIRDHEKTVQSHSLAEAILIFKIFQSQLCPKDRGAVLAAIRKTMEVLYISEDHYFINNAKRIAGIFIKDKTEMVRWSNAWMFYALSYK